MTLSTLLHTAGIIKTIIGTIAGFIILIIGVIATIAGNPSGTIFLIIGALLFVVSLISLFIKLAFRRRF